MTFWIKSPLVILASGAENGLVIEADEFIELVGAGAEPATQMDKIFDATARFVLPGLINSYHHFYQTLTRFHPNAINKKLFLWLEKLYPIWECLEPEGRRLAVRVLPSGLFGAIGAALGSHLACALHSFQ